MTTLPTVDLNNNPALLRDDWLPTDTQFDELNDLAATHRALLEELNELARQRAALKGQFEREDEAQQAALLDAHREGVDQPKLPKRTPPSKREEVLEASREQSRLKIGVLEDLVARIVARVQEREGEWCEVLGGEEREAAQRVEDLRRELEEAIATSQATPKLRMWVERTARNRPGMHLQWSALANPPTTDLLKIANEGRTRGNSIPSMALTKQEVQDAGGEVTPDDYADETLDYSSEAYLSQLDEALREHAMKRLAGGSAPGGM